jgi:spore coat polysaccharide biosynthesis predicted glycosyltransferase SpsG
LQGRERFTVLTNVTDMADLMVNSDLCVGAAGSTAWERCCLGLPTLMMVLADNQKNIARNLEQQGAVILSSGNPEEISSKLARLLKSSRLREQLAQSSWSVCDGLGIERVIDAIGVN